VKTVANTNITSAKKEPSKENITIRNCFGFALKRSTPSAERLRASRQESRPASENLRDDFVGETLLGARRDAFVATGFEIFMPATLAGRAFFFAALETAAGRVGLFNLNL
jgi:hypothetical protein